MYIHRRASQRSGKLMTNCCLLYTSDSWVKSDETGFPVDQDKIDTLVSSLNSIKAERTLENVEDASEYELDQPDNTITVTTEAVSYTHLRQSLKHARSIQFLKRMRYRKSLILLKLSLIHISYQFLSHP